MTKAGDITHLTDARYFAAWEVDYLGFPLGNNGISTAEFQAIREWITGPKLVGEFDLLSEEIQHTVLPTLQLDGIQVNELAPIEILQTLKSAASHTIFMEQVIQGYHLKDDLLSVLTERKEVVDYFMLNFTKGGVSWQDLEEGHPFDLNFLGNLCTSFPVLLEIEGELPSQMKAALADLKGFSVRGGAEEKVGYKDFDALADFFEDLEVED